MVRRVVLHYRSGALSGLREITGCWDADPTLLLPRVEHVAQLDGRAAVLARVANRYALYEEEVV